MTHFVNNLDHSTVSIQSVLYTSMSMLAIYTIIIYTATTSLGFSVELGIIIFYFTLLVFLSLPSMPGGESRSYFFRLLRIGYEIDSSCMSKLTFISTIVFFPLSAITFPEVLLADALTSLSRSFKDLAITLVAVYSHSTGSSITEHHNFALVLVALLASLPYWLRVRQCSVQLSGASDFMLRLPIMLNIGKYCTSFPPLWLAAALGLGYGEDYIPMYIMVASTLNSLYGFSWDMIMDWGLFTVYRNGRITGRAKFLLPYIFHVVALVINFMLRFLWAAHHVSFLAAMNPLQLALLVEMLEVCRRGIWFIFRVEWEILVQQDKDKSVKLRGEEISADDEDALLLSPNSPRPTKL